MSRAYPPKLKYCSIALLIASLGADTCYINVGSHPNTPISDPKSIQLAAPNGTCSGVSPGIWFDRNAVIGPLTPGYKVRLAGKSDGSGSFYVDDALEILCQEITAKGELTGALNVWAKDFSNGCTAITWQDPVEITDLGNHNSRVSCRIIFKDLCGGCRGSSEIWAAYVR